MIPEIGPLNTFGLMLAFAFVADGILAARRFRELGKPADYAYEAVFAAAAGGVIGARIDWAIQNPDDWETLGDVITATGLVFFGGLIGGALGVILWARWRGMLNRHLLDLGGPAIALGYAIGRIGCQTSGDGDYGIASTLPWAMAFPDGTVPTLEEVHPTPIYETVTMGLVAMLLWHLRDRFRPGLLLPLYLVLGGIERFLVEFIRRNPDTALGLTTPQLFALAMLVLGSGWLAVATRGGWRAPAAAG